MNSDIAEELIQVVESWSETFKTLDEEKVRLKPNPEKWSVQEILGHLIDSASNNHQRFVRAQQAKNLVFSNYNQDIWVEIQGYNELPWDDLVELWRLNNIHLARVIDRIPEEKLRFGCKIGDSNILTLGYLVKDYLRHLKHHLNQIEEKFQLL